ncbi:hypothetical protein [Sinorhizobium medicae]
MHTKDFLAQELEKAGLPKMAKRARRGLYHDFLSPLDSPSLLLESDLQKAARLPEPTDDLRLSSGVVPLAHHAGGLTHLGLADYGAALPAVLDRGPEHGHDGLGSALARPINAFFYEEVTLRRGGSRFVPAVLRGRGVLPCRKHCGVGLGQFAHGFSKVPRRRG